MIKKIFVFCFCLFSVIYSQESHQFFYQNFNLSFSSSLINWDYLIKSGSDIEAYEQPFLDEINQNYSFRKNLNQFGISVGYEVFKDLEISVIVGLEKQKINVDFYDDLGYDYDFSFQAAKPNIYFGGGIKYSYSPWDKLKFTIYPSFIYNSSSNLEIYYEDENSMDPNEYSTKTKNYLLNINFSGGYQLGDFFPYIGINYLYGKDKIDSYEKWTEFDEDGELILMEWNNTKEFSIKNSLAFSTGVQFNFYKIFTLTLEGLIGKGYAINSSIKYDF